jgi:hypothetical protein
MNTMKDVDLIVTNLKNCLSNLQKLASMDTSSKMSLTIHENSNCCESIQYENQLIRVKKCLESFNLNENDLIYKKINLDFISEFGIERTEFIALIEKFVLEEEPGYEFEFFVKVLLKNQDYLFEKETNLFKVFDLDHRYIESLQILSKCIKIILDYIAKYDLDEILTKSNKKELGEFLIKSYEYKPNLFRILLEVKLNTNEEASKFFKKFSKNDKKLAQLFNLKNKEEEQDNEEEIANEAETFYLEQNWLSSKEKKEINTKSLQELLSLYKYTMSKKDMFILSCIYKLDPKLDSLIFRLNENTVDINGNTLNQQVKIVDFIMSNLNETYMTNSIQNYPIHRKLDELNNKSEILEEKFDFDSILLNNNVHETSIYDPIYILPNFYSMLNYGKF